MPPHTPQETRGIANPDWTPPATETQRSPQLEDRRRFTGWTMLAGVLLLLVIVALVALL